MRFVCSNCFTFLQHKGLWIIFISSHKLVWFLWTFHMVEQNSAELCQIITDCMLLKTPSFFLEVIGRLQDAINPLPLTDDTVSFTDNTEINCGLTWSGSNKEMPANLKGTEMPAFLSLFHGNLVWSVTETESWLTPSYIEMIPFMDIVRCVWPKD